MKPIFYFEGDGCRLALFDVDGEEIALSMITPEGQAGVCMPPDILLKLGNAFRDAAMGRIKPEGVA